MDTTPPKFVGRILVHLDGGYLVAVWGDYGFTDNEDTDIVYQVGIGEIIKTIIFLTTKIQFQHLISVIGFAFICRYQLVLLTSCSLSRQ